MQMGRTFPKAAPTITGLTLSNIVHATEPTKGEVWAFPQEEVKWTSAATRPSVETVSRQRNYWVLAVL
jgi:hypothetical protein